jgi:hypothetical protein
MPLLNELIVSIVGGIATALILSVFTRGGRAPAQRVENRKPARSGFGNFLHVLFAVTGGVAFAVVGGRVLFQSGVLERSLPMRMTLLVAATILIWMVIGAMRPRR